jgi:hypothetical protein
LAVVAALACSLGLHWGFLQSAAWVGMVVSYSQNTPFTVAVVKTFDGKHPCSLCKHIAQGRQSEKKTESPPAAKKMECSCWASSFVFVAPAGCWELDWPEDLVIGRSQIPPVPPPKQLPG